MLPSKVCVFQPEKAKKPRFLISFVCVGRVFQPVAPASRNMSVFPFSHVWLLMAKVGVLSLGSLLPAKSHIK